MISLFKSRFFSNIFFQFAGKFLSIIFSLINISILTRVLCREGYGEYVTVFAYLGLFSMIGNFGMDKILIREVVKKSQKLKVKSQKLGEFLASALVLRFLLITFASLLAIFISFLLPYSEIVRKGILIVSLTFIFNLLTLVFVDYFQAKMQFDKSVLIDAIADKGVQTFLILILFFLGIRSTLSYLGTSFLAALISFIFGFFLFKKAINSSFVLSIPSLARKEWRKLLTESFPLAITVFLDQAKKIDLVLLSFFSGTKVVGIYGLADRIFENAVMPSALVFSVFFPVVVERVEDKKFFKKFKKILIYLAMVSIFISGLLFLLSPLVIKVLSGSEFGDSVFPLRILSLAIFAQYVITPLDYLLIAQGRQAFLAKAQFLATFSNIILNLFLIPKFGLIGAAWVRVFSLFLLLSMVLFAFRRPTSEESLRNVKRPSHV